MYQSPRSCFVFGEFRLDGAERRLLRHGTPISLPPKILDTLLLLVENAGHLVEKDEFMKRLWPGTFVGEDTLARNISILRKTLGESSDSQSFIATVPTRGYRFVTPVQVVSESEPHVAEKQSLKDTAVLTEAAAATEEPKLLGHRQQGATIGSGVAVSREAPGLRETPSLRSWLRRIAFAALVLSAGCVAGVVTFLLLSPAPLSDALLTIHIMHRRPMLSSKDTIVLGEFANSTGDPVFDGTLRKGLSVQLEQSPFLSLVSEEGIHQTLRMMGQPANARLTPEITREICERTSSTTSLTGSIALIGSKYDLILKAVSCANGDPLASTEAQANDKSRVLDALSKAASDMRTKLGESLSSVQTHNTSLVQATTPSLEALQAYNLGWKAVNAEFDSAGALPFFQRAVQLDPNFAMAYWAMGWSYAALGESALSAENSRRAFELRAGVSELEKLIIEVDYYNFATADLIKGLRSCEVGTRTFPRDPFFAYDLGVFLNELGQYEASLKANLESLRLAPYNSYFYRNTVFNYLLLDRVAEAEALAKEAHAKGLDAHLAAVLYAIAFYRGDTAQMAKHAASAAGKPGDEDLLLALQADTAAYFGQLREARELSRKAADSASRAGEKETAAGYDAVSALREALFGHADEALRQTTHIISRSAGRDVEYGVAFALAYAGDANQAQVLADNFANRHPEDTVVQFNYLPALRAKLALRSSGPSSPGQALNILKAAASYELGLPAFSFYNWPNLYPVYVRGEAYLAAHRGREAAREFQKILDHRGIVLNEPIGALAHLQLGRAYAMQGDTAKALAAYRDFFTLWKEADPEIPVLRRAKAEYAKLQ